MILNSKQNKISTEERFNMKKNSTTKFAFLAMLAGVAILLSGCAARELIVSEVLRVPEQATIRTAYNLWYTNPMEMDTINHQQGTIIPFGTEVVITKATEEEIFFKTIEDGKEFRIVFEPHYRLQTPEQYLYDLFTAKSEDELRDGLDALTYEKVRRGFVEKGMPVSAVLLAFGPPCKYRTPDPSQGTWLYPVAYLEYKRILIRDGKVFGIILP